MDPAEVESTLLTHPDVVQAHVRPRGDRLIAYLVARDPAHPPAGAILREFVGRTLPGYMVPAELVVLAALPLDSRGKVDADALARTRVPAGGSPEGDAPMGDVEDVIAAIWRETLSVDRIGLDGNFFDLGGHSLLVLTVHRLLVNELGRDVPLLALFQYPTVRALAQYLTQGEDGAETQPAVIRPQGGRSRLLRQRAQRAGRP